MSKTLVATLLDTLEQDAENLRPVLGDSNLRVFYKDPPSLSFSIWVKPSLVFDRSHTLPTPITPRTVSAHSEMALRLQQQALLKGMKTLQHTAKTLLEHLQEGSPKTPQTEVPLIKGVLTEDGLSVAVGLVQSPTINPVFVPITERSFLVFLLDALRHPVGKSGNAWQVVHRPQPSHPKATPGFTPFSLFAPNEERALAHALLLNQKFAWYFCAEHKIPAHNTYKQKAKKLEGFTTTLYKKVSFPKIQSASA